MPFPDGPTGGLFLIQPAIRSPNFVDGLVGWTINQDGTAQFYNVVIIGNDLKVLGTGGGYVEIHSVAGIARIELQPSGANLLPGKLITGVTGGGAPQLVMASPQQTATLPNDVGTLLLQGATSTIASVASLTADDVSLSGSGTAGGSSAGIEVGATTAATAAHINLFTPSSNTSIGMDGGGLSLANNIAISATSLSLLVGTINDGANRRFLLTQLDNFDCTATVTVGGAFVPANMTHTYLNISAGAKWSATVTCDTSLNATAGNAMHTQLVVAGVVQPNTLDQGPRPSTTDSASRTWSGTFAAGGSLSFAVNSQITGGGGLGNQIIAGTSTLQVKIYE